MKAWILGAQNSGFVTTGTVFQPLCGGDGTASALTTDALAAIPMPHALTLDQLTVTVSTLPGAGKTWTCTVFKNGVATALTVTITNSSLTATDSVHSVSFAQGDTASLQIVPGGGTPTASGMVSWLTRQTATGCFAVLGGSTAAVTASTFVGPMGAQGNNTTENNQTTPIPVAGTLSNLFLQLSAAPGGSGANAITATLRKGAFGALADQTLTCTATDPSLTAHDTTHSVAIAAGDLVTTHLVVTGTPSLRAFVSYTFTPTTDGDAFWCHTNSASPTTGTTPNYDPIIGGQGGAWSSTETSRSEAAPPVTMKAFYVLAVSAPGGSGKQYTITVRKNAAATALSVVCNSAAAGQKPSITGQSVSTSLNDLLALESVAGATTPFSGQFNTGIYYVDSPSVAPAFVPKILAMWQS